MIKKSPIRLVLADDHVILRDALAFSIDASEEFLVTGRASDGYELMDVMENGELPDIVLLDLSMPKMDGYDAAAIIQKKYPSVKMLVLTMYDSEIALIRLLQSGVRGFLKKDVHPKELKEALLKVADDGYHYSNSTTGKLGFIFNKAKKKKISIDKSFPSDVEIEFLKLASTDMTYKEIAMSMKLTPRAVDSYRDALFEKLDVKSRVGLAIFAIRNGIIGI
jgi:two-component system, NarL family, invasion response regulator UvrY